MFLHSESSEEVLQLCFMQFNMSVLEILFRGESGEMKGGVTCQNT